MGKDMENGQFLSHSYHLLSPAKRYLLLAAIPEEYSHFLSLTKPWRKLSGKHFHILASMQPSKAFFFYPTGMGVRHIISHWKAIIDLIKPDVIISFGFCGELFSSKSSGLFLGTHYYPFPQSSYFKPLEQTLSVEIIEFCIGSGITLAKVITTPVFLSKKDTFNLTQNSLPLFDTEQLKASNIIIDMESAIIANLAHQASIPFLSLRATTDAHDKEVPFDVERLLNEQGFVSPKKVISLLVRNPALLFHFLHFWRISLKASKNLSIALWNFLSLPPRAFEIKPPRVVVPFFNP